MYFFVLNREQISTLNMAYNNLAMIKKTPMNIIIQIQGCMHDVTAENIVMADCFH